MLLLCIMWSSVKFTCHGRCFLLIGNKKFFACRTSQRTRDVGSSCCFYLFFWQSHQLPSFTSVRTCQFIRQTAISRCKTLTTPRVPFLAKIGRRRTTLIFHVIAPKPCVSSTSSSGAVAVKMGLWCSTVGFNNSGLYRLVIWRGYMTWWRLPMAMSSQHHRLDCMYFIKMQLVRVSDVTHIRIPFGRYVYWFFSTQIVSI